MRIQTTLDQKTIVWWALLAGGLVFSGRLAAELLLGWSPIGYDSSVSYPDILLQGWSSAVWSFDLLSLLHRFLIWVGIPGLFAIKLGAALVSGLLAFSLAVFLNKVGSLSTRISGLGAVLICATLPVLRLTQDLQRNTLGVALALLLWVVLEVRPKGWQVFSAVLAVLLLRAHELATAAALMVGGLVLIQHLFRTYVTSWYGRLALCAGYFISICVFAPHVSFGSVPFWQAGPTERELVIPQVIAWVGLVPALLVYSAVGFSRVTWAIRGALLLAAGLALSGRFSLPDRWYFTFVPLLCVVAVIGLVHLLKLFRGKWAIQVMLVLAILIPGLGYLHPSAPLVRRQETVGTPGFFAVHPPSFWASGLIANADEWRSVRRIPECLSWVFATDSEQVVVVPVTYYPSIALSLPPSLRWRVAPEGDSIAKDRFGLGFRLDRTVSHKAVAGQPSGCDVIRYN